MAKITVEQERCKGCGICIAFCPKKVIQLSKNLNPKGFFPAELINEKECTGCAICALMCPDVAIEVYRQEREKK